MAEECTDEVCCQEIFVGDEGLPIQFWVHTCDTTVTPHVEAPKDVSLATALDIKFLDVNGVYSDLLVGENVTDGTDGLVEYVTLATTFTVSGPWKGQLEVLLPEGRKSTTIIEFDVSEKM